MSTSTRIGDDFLRIPKLDVAGTNWVIYKDRFMWSVDARGLVEHVDGTGAKPKAPKDRAKPEEPTKTELEAEETWKKELKIWKQDEAIVKQQIAGTIPDSLFMKIRNHTTAFDIWDALTKEFQVKSRMVSVDLRRRLGEEKCGEKGDIRTHFSKLRTMREDLAAMGHPPTDDDFYAIVLGSLPSSYDLYIGAISATSSVIGKTPTADELMLTVTEEYERRSLRTKGGKKDENAAFSAADDKHSKKKNVECFNCKKKGHYKADCWAPGGGKEGQGPKGKGKPKDSKEAAATAKIEKTDAKEEAWMVADVESETFESDVSTDLGDVFDDVFEGLLDLENEMGGEDGESEEVYRSTFGYATLTDGNEKNQMEVQLYDSGATRHMSGYRHRFINYKPIPPKPIITADKRSFNAIGQGDMYINIPNDNTTS